MFNLVLKDFKIIKRIMIFGCIYGFILAFMGAKSIKEGNLNQGFAVFYTLFMTYFSILYANSYDEKNKANFFLRSLPIPKGDIVISKYLAIAVYTVFYYVIFAAAALISNAVLSVNSTAYDIKIFIIILIINLLVFGIQYPFYFKYGSKFLHIFRIIGFLLIFILPNAINKIIKSVDKENLIGILNWINENQQIFTLILTLMAAVIILVTMLLSIRIYSNKDLV